MSIKKISILFLAFLVLLGTVYGSYWVYSNMITVEVGGYSLNLSWTMEGDKVTLNASLTQNSSPKSNVEVTFFECNNAEDITSQLGMNTTDLNGCAFYSLTPTNGTHYYKAGYEVP